MEFEPKPNKSNINCSVFGCHSRKNRDNRLTYHNFPKPGIINVEAINKFGQKELVDRRKAWEMACKSGQKATKYMTVCSRHFLPSDYCFPDTARQRRKLKITSVPSQNLPKIFQKSTNKPRHVINRIACDDTLQIHGQRNDADENIMNDDSVINDEKLINSFSSRLETAHALLELINFKSNVNDKSCHVDYGD